MKYLRIVLFLSSLFCASRGEAHNDYRDGLHQDVRILELHNSWVSGASCLCGVATDDTFVSAHPPITYLLAWPHLPSVMDRLRAEGRRMLAQAMLQQLEPKPEFTVDWRRVYTLIGMLCILLGLVWEFKAVSRLR